VFAGRHLPAIGSGVALLALWVALLGSFRAEIPLMVAVAMSALALAALGLCWRRLTINQTRVLADVTLLTPAIVLLFVR
jgi:hypothetical protein